MYRREEWQKLIDRGDHGRDNEERIANYLGALAHMADWVSEAFKLWGDDIVLNVRDVDRVDEPLHRDDE